MIKIDNALLGYSEKEIDMYDEQWKATGNILKYKNLEFERDKDGMPIEMNFWLNEDE